MKDEVEAVQGVVACAECLGADGQQSHAQLRKLRNYFADKYAIVRAHDAAAMAMVKRHIDEEQALELATREKLEALMQKHCSSYED